MKFVLLPDHDVSTKARMHDLAFSLCDDAESVHVHHYSHWYGASKTPFPDSEFEHFVSSTTAMEKVIFVSEGRGAELVLNALQKNSVEPLACVFICARAVPQTKKILKKTCIPGLFLKRCASSGARFGRQMEAASQEIQAFVNSISKRQSFKP
ncbi:MAG: hypothetical protein AABX53_01895 [Nanoarchaeota archaeon]